MLSGKSAQSPLEGRKIVTLMERHAQIPRVVIVLFQDNVLTAVVGSGTVGHVVWPAVGASCLTKQSQQPLHISSFTSLAVQEL